MPKPHVTLFEVLQALGGPLEEPALWALLQQTGLFMLRALAGKYVNSRVLCMTESQPCRASYHNIASVLQCMALLAPPPPLDPRGADLLITPESVLLYPGGAVSVLRGTHDGSFRAPEASRETEPGPHEKVYRASKIIFFLAKKNYESWTKIFCKNFPLGIIKLLFLLQEMILHCSIIMIL